MIYNANGKPAPRTTYRLGIFEWLAILSAALLYFFAWFSPAHGVEPNVQLFPGPVLLTSMPQASPDSQRVVYADASGLWSVNLHGGASYLLAPLLSRQLFGAAQITPDGSRVIFISDQNTLGKPELHSVSIMGGPVTRISRDMAADRQVRDFLISPTSQRVYFAADSDTNNKMELYSVPVAGGPSTKLNASILAGHDVFEYAVSQQDRLVYRVGISPEQSLWTVPGNGRAADARRISRTMVTGGGVDDFTITKDGTRVLYIADAEDNGEFNLYVVAISGGSSTRLNAPMGGVVTFREENSSVAYEQRIGAVTSWFSVPVTGGVPVPVPPPVEPPVTSPDGRWTLYPIHYPGGVTVLWSAGPGGLHKVNCTGQPVVTTFLAKPAYSISPDSKHVVYVASGEVWASPISGAVCLIWKDGFESEGVTRWN